MIQKCPRCGGTEFSEHDRGPDSYDDDIFYISEKCLKCGLWLDGWTHEWFESEDAMDNDEAPWTASKEEKSR